MQKHSFLKFQTKSVIEHSDIKRYQSYFNEFKNSELDSNLLKNFQLIFYINTGYYYYCKFNYSQALQSLKEAYYLNPDNLKSKGMISEIVRNYLVSDASNMSAADSLVCYLDTFPFLNDDKFFISIYQYRMAESAYEYFQQNKPGKGNEYLVRLESFIEKNKGIDIERGCIEEIFGNLSAYYVQKQQYESAVSILRRGLKIFPDSPELNHRLSTILKYKKDFNTNEVPEMDIRTYTEAIKKVEKNRHEINNNVEKYLKGNWYTSFEAGERGEKNYNVPKISFTLCIVDMRTANIIAENESQTVSWEYSKLNCTLSFSEAEDFESLRLIITDITADTLNGVLYFEDPADGCIEVSFTSGRTN